MSIVSDKKNTSRRAALPVFRTDVRTGGDCLSVSLPAAGLHRRFCFGRLTDFIYDASSEKVMILFGLRGTGKTTLIRQAVCGMDTDTLSRTALINAASSDTLADVCSDVLQLEKLRFRYVFIDGVTLLPDFIDGAAVFSDIFAASGMKIVLSGDESLSFYLALNGQLYDRCVTVHTTFISFRESEQVLGVRGLDDYIRYGGLTAPYGDPSLADYDKAVGYVASAVSGNILNSVRRCGDADGFRGLRGISGIGGLSGVVSSIVENTNRRFAADVLASLNIPYAADLSLPVGPEHAEQIREYLRLLDLVVEMDAVNWPGAGPADHFDVMTQPGLRYVQADALVSALERNGVFNSLPERAAVLERIRSEIRGRMTEEIVLLETKLARPKARVFRLRFAVGEFDMVVYDPASMTCALYEIKHSDAAVPELRRHLLDAEKCAAAEHLYGKITGKYVLYRGEDTLLDGVRYLNVEEYLRDL